MKEQIFAPIAGVAFCPYPWRTCLCALRAKTVTHDCAGVFSAMLGGRNGVPEQEVFFAPASTTETGGSYTDIMIQECEKLGMKPVCDHPSYCKTDNKAFYIGQDHHVEHGGHRNTDSYFPTGWSEVRDHFHNLCAYTANHGGHEKALCHDGGGSHAWKTPGENNKFMCAGAGESIKKVYPEHCTRCESGFQYFKKPGKDYGACGNCDASCSKCVEQDARSCTKCEDPPAGGALRCMLPQDNIVTCDGCRVKLHQVAGHKGWRLSWVLP